MLKVERLSEWGRPAGFVTRLIAFLIDLTINVVVISTLTFVSQFIGRSLGLGQPTLVLLAIITVACGFGFLLLYEVLLTVMGGQTVGKRIMGLRVIRTDGARVKLWPAVKRLVGYVLSLPLFWGYLLVLVDRRRQAFHDHLADTFVIYYTVPKGELGAFEQHLKAIQVRRQAKLAVERETRQAAPAQESAEQPAEAAPESTVPLA